MMRLCGNLAFVRWPRSLTASSDMFLDSCFVFSYACIAMELNAAARIGSLSPKSHDPKSRV